MFAVFALLIIPSVSSAILLYDESIYNNCMPGDVFSRKTGQPCTTNTVKPECRPGDLFSSVTGKRCDDVIAVPPIWCHDFNIDAKVGNSSEEISVLRKLLVQEGLAASSGGVPDSVFDQPLSAAVKAFQEKYKSEILTPARLNAGTGYVGARTRAKLNALYGCTRPVPPPVPCAVLGGDGITARPECMPNNGGVVISGVSGPQTLDVGQTGTWTVTAYDKNGGNLSYAVMWGDEVRLLSPMDSSAGMFNNPQQSATFTHSYTQGGMYKPTFIVTSENTIRCITTPCPGNGGRAQTSLTVNVGYGNVSPAVTVLTPNGGEKWQTGSKQKVTLSRTGFFPSTSVVVFFLGEGPSNGILGGARPLNNTGVYEVTVPDQSIIQGDVGLQFVPGSYKLKAVVYDKTPCLGLCPASDAKAMVQDMSNNFFTIERN